MIEDTIDAAKQLKANDEYDNMRSTNRRAADDFWAAFDKAKQSKATPKPVNDEPKKGKTE